MKRQPILSALLFTLVLIGGIVAGRAHAAQPHMNAALNHLRSAHRELDAATSDKGGHRARAIGLVRDAISEVEAGIEYGRR
jgi:hypothetical protein